MPSHNAEHWAADLSAYLDGELSPAERRRVEAHLTESPQARRMLDELRSTSQAVRSLPRASLPVEVASRLRDEIARRGVLIPRAAASVQTRLFLWTVRAGSMAALIAVFAVAGWQLTRSRVEAPTPTKMVAMRDSRDETTFAGTGALESESESRESGQRERGRLDASRTTPVAAAHTFEVTIVPATQAEHDDIRRQLSNFSGLVAASEMLRNQQANPSAQSATPSKSPVVSGVAERTPAAASGLQSLGYAAVGEGSRVSRGADDHSPLPRTALNRVELKQDNTPYVAYDLNLSPQSLDKLVHSLRLQVATEENSASGVWLIAAANAAEKSANPAELITGGYREPLAGGVVARSRGESDATTTLKGDEAGPAAAAAVVDKDSDMPMPAADRKSQQSEVRASSAPSIATIAPAAGRVSAPPTGARSAGRGGAGGGAAVSPEKREVEARREKIAARKETRQQSGGGGRGQRNGRDAGAGLALDAPGPAARLPRGGARAPAAVEAGDQEARPPVIPPETIAQAGKALIDFVKGVTRETRSLLDSVSLAELLAPVGEEDVDGPSPINVRINLLPPADAGARLDDQALPEPARSRNP